MVALLDGAGRRDRVVVVVEGGDELVGLATMEPVPAVEPPGQRPRMAGRGHVGLVVGGQVPLPDGVGGVAAITQDLREEAVLLRDLAVVAGEADGEVGDPAEAVAMVVAAGQQACPGGRAQRGGVEVGEANAAVGEAVDRRSGHVGAVAAELGEAHVVEHHEQDVRSALRWTAGVGPPRRRGAPVVTDDTLERLRFHPTSRLRRGSPVGTVLPPQKPPRERRRRGPLNRSARSAIPPGRWPWPPRTGRP